MQEWLNLVSIAESISYTEDCDAIIWVFDSSNKFTVHTMYKTISFRGIQPVYTPVVWNLHIPPRIHVFLWLLSNNKTLTRTNLAKRRTLEDISCLFCAEDESVQHLSFSCCVATLMWKHLSDISNIQIGEDFESVARWWINNNKNSVLNMSGAALLWCIWNLHNGMCFQGKSWRNEKVLLNKLARTLKSWLPLCKENNVESLNRVIRSLKTKS